MTAKTLSIVIAGIFTLAGVAKATEWPTQTPVEAGLDPALLERLTTENENGEIRRIRGIVIIRNGELAWEGYFNGADASEKTNVRSASKTILSTAVGVAIGEGALSGVDAKVTDLVKRFRKHKNPDPRKRDITVEDMLTMSSLVECSDNDQFSRGNEGRMYLIEDWPQFYFDLPMRGFPEWVPTPDKAKYGRSWSYCTAGTVALGAVMEDLLGERLDSYAQEKIFGPIGVAGVDWQLTPTGNAMTGGGVAWTARDAARYGQLYLNDGEWDGKRILPGGWVEQSFQRRAETDYGSDYGYLWWIEDIETPSGKITAWSASGNGGNKVYVVPDRDLVVVINSTNYATRGMHDQAKRILEEFILAGIE